MTNKKLKAYFWKPDRDSDTGLAIIAENSNQAKKMGYIHWASDVGVEPETWIEQRITLIKNTANCITGLKEGVVDFKEGIRRNLYAWGEDECDICQADTKLSNYDGKALCDSCIEQEENTF